jgi:hypothetical protein
MESEAALHLLPQPVLVVDAEARLCFVNAAGAQLLRERMALRLVSGAGRRLNEAADESGVSSNTAPAQLRALFAKTGMRRQADLVRLPWNIAQHNLRIFIPQTLQRPAKGRRFRPFCVMQITPG